METVNQLASWLPIKSCTYIYIYIVCTSSIDLSAKSSKLAHASTTTTKNLCCKNQCTSSTVHVYFNCTRRLIFIQSPKKNLTVLSMDYFLIIKHSSLNAYPCILPFLIPEKKVSHHICISAFAIGKLPGNQIGVSRFPWRRKGGEAEPGTTW